MKYPKPLQLGDKVALTAPSSPVPESNLLAAVESIKFMGLVPIVMPSCRMQHGYVAGPDKQRAEDINNAFADSNIKGVFCLRGGYGATRILPLINFDVIKANPKVFLGYSDITALHTVINQKCGIITFHGPMPNTDYRKLDEFTLSSLKNSLFAPNKVTSLHNPNGEDMKILHEGVCEGILTGGNISLLMATLGSPYEIDTKDKILFMEDVGERPFRLDKSLTALALAGKFKDCSGIILGTFAECEEPNPKDIPHNTVIANDYLSLEQIIQEVILPWNKPTMINLRAGHIYPQSTLPLGADVKLNLNSTATAFTIFQKRGY